jgi:hypothetical protein
LCVCWLVGVCEVDTMWNTHVLIHK